MLKQTWSQGVGGDCHTANDQYLTWIKNYCDKVNSDPSFVGDNWTLSSRLRGSCGSASTAMQKEFPELLLVRGTVVSKQGVKSCGISTSEELQDLICPDDGHIWLETTTGEIVDPTSAQVLLSKRPPLHCVR